MFVDNYYNNYFFIDRFAKIIFDTMIRVFFYFQKVSITGFNPSQSHLSAKFPKETFLPWAHNIGRVQIFKLYEKNQ